MTLAALLVATVAVSSAAGGSPEERFEKANVLYRAGDFAGAASAYEALAAEGLSSGALHHNLGNARYRLGVRGAAIASWERALRLEPGDDDARENLRAARSDDPDRALCGEATLFSRLVERTGDGAALALFVAPWWLLWGALALRSRAGRRARAALAAAAILAAVGVLCGGALLVGRARDRAFPLAIVTAPSTPVRAGPSAALKADFELHEGTRVRLREVAGDLARVRLDGGLEGWLPRRDVEPL